MFRQGQKATIWGIVLGVLISYTAIITVTIIRPCTALGTPDGIIGLHMPLLFNLPTEMCFKSDKPIRYIMFWRTDFEDDRLYERMPNPKSLPVGVLIVPNSTRSLIETFVFKEKPLPKFIKIDFVGERIRRSDARIKEGKIKDLYNILAINSLTDAG